VKTIEHRINGTAAGSGRAAPVYDPATGRRQAEVLLAGKSEVDTAVAAAGKAFESWGTSSLSQRTRILFAFRELLVKHETDLAKNISAEHGKVLDDARGEIVRGREVVEYACGIADALKGGFSDQVSRDVDVLSFRQPLGVCAGITPFNFPVMVPFWMHPMAIATGNTFVLKPSERVPSASNLVAELYAEAGLPDGVFNVVHGDKAAVDALLEHPDVAAVSFVGSTPIAKYVHERATATGKRVQALGGAKNHAVVLPDADLEYAANHLTAAAFGSAGQRCMAISVAVAVGDAADALVATLARKAREVKVGPGDDPASEMGRLLHRAIPDRPRPPVDGRLSRRGLRPGARGRARRDPGRGDRADQRQSLRQRHRAVHSGGEAARRFQREVRVGMIGVNVPIPVPMSYYSFGGWKDSLIGDSPIHGPEGVRFYTRPKVVTTRWPRVTQSVEAAFHFPTSS
jgi:malonate-semialdehyde dehydrogenase (acetylating)/methylmalonate-semialdehyde dehydrogenase